MEKTTIAITHETWRQLNTLKRVGESFEDVIIRIIQERQHLVTEE